MADEINGLLKVKRPFWTGQAAKRRVAMVALMKMPKDASADSWAERRLFPRADYQGQVQGHRLDHTIEARQEPRMQLILRDLSLGGLSAICDRPLGKGEHLTVSFPRKGAYGSWDAFGRVLRCDHTGFGYSVAVEFDPLPAA